MLLRWNTPQYPRICPSTTTHCTHSAHENGLHHQAPLRCLPGPDQTKGPLRERDVPPPRPRPSLGPLGGDPGRSRAGAEQVVRFPPPDLWRPHRSSYSRYVRGGETAASQQENLCSTFIAFRTAKKFTVGTLVPSQETHHA